MNASQRRVVTSACPRNCYSTCGLSLQVEGGRLTAVEPLAANRATAGGPCLKGLAYVERVASPDRLLHPLRRQPGGGFAPIRWDDALDAIAEQLEEARRRHGPRSVLYYSASGTKGLLNGAGEAFWRLFGGATTTYGDLCWPAGLEAGRLTLGANVHNAPWDLPNARLIVLWGKNPAETNLHQMGFIEAARTRGAAVVVVDPRRTESAERADLFLRPRPGSDGALALAVAGQLIREGRVARDFVDAHVHGFDDFARLAATWTPVRASEVCDIPAAQIEAFAALWGERRPATLIAGYGMQRYANSGQTLRALIALPALTGDIGRPGGGWQFANLQSHVFGPHDPLPLYPEYRPEQGSDDLLRPTIATARLGADMLAADPPLAVAWVERGNPLSQNPDSGRVRQAFRALDFRVVVDQFLTDSAREADIVLPAKSFLEQADVLTAYWHPYLQYRAKVMDPPGEVRTETSIYRALAARLGFDPAAVDAAIPGPDDQTVERWLAARVAALGLDLETLKAGPVLSPDFAEVAFADRVFPTPSGRIELRSEEAAARWGANPLPEFSEPLEAGRRDPQLAARYPLLLMTPNTKNRIHSQFGNLAMIRALDPAPTLQAHPDDAAARGLVHGERVRVFNDRGELTLPLALTSALKPGCVLAHNGWWESEGGGVNRLSAGRETDMGHGAAFHENRVQIERAAQ
ncbi:MAG: molybdopterin-dependent oxidoreductase [Candidatus Krumholzibacteriia bacterium]|nr:molybdopterin-dependent oxidoreductase [Candidatus Latescibacterota bacterium]MCB9514589.1 molybdopterin-dependent oxidoreductase [Candidatus Latescibacterota bacterium]